MANAMMTPPALYPNMRARAQTFYLASLFLPAAVRRDVRQMYAYFRTVDDLVDDPPHGWTRGDILAMLHSWNEQLEGSAPAGPLISRVLHIVSRYRIPLAHVTMILEGARFDLDMHSIETLEELRAYSLLVAGSVGMAMSHILGATGEPTLAAARELGIGMQLTNVLRDVGEDARLGRVYLPRAILSDFGCSPEALVGGQVTDPLRFSLRLLASHAREGYRRGLEGIAELDRSVRFPIYLAARLYARILDKIEQQDFDVFTQRAHVSAHEKCTDALRLYLGYRQSGSLPGLPEAGRIS